MPPDRGASNLALIQQRRKKSAREKIRRGLLQVAARLITTPPLTHPPRKLLLIRPDHLGDVLFITPTLSWLKTQWPHAHLTPLVGPWSTAVLRHNPAVDDLRELPFPGFTRANKPSVWQPYQLLFEWAQRLRREQFDAALILRSDHWWGAWLAAQAGIPRRIGYAWPEVTPFLTEALPFDPNQHEAARNLTLAARLLGSDSLPTSAPLQFFPTKADYEFAKTWAERRVIAVHPGAGAAVKLWQPHKWMGVMNQLAEAFKAEVILTGAKAEEPLCQAIAAGLTMRHQVLAGQTTLGQLAAVFQCCQCVLGPDSGPLHLAVAMGTPTIHLYGPAAVNNFGPWGNAQRQRAIMSAWACAPCGILDWTDLAEHPCVREIEEAEVVEAARQIRATQ